MDTAEQFERLGIALAIGLLIGLERGWRERDAQGGSRTAGIRTFTLIGLLGGIWGVMTPLLGPAPLAAAAFGFAVAFTLFQWRETSAKGEFSVTSTVVGFVVFGLGAYAVLGDQVVAVAAGVAVMAILAARAPMHEFLKKLTWAELRSAILLLGMSFVLLPILPDGTVDPWDAVNPYQLWLITVVLAVVSFAGYVAVRILGERWGLLVSSVAGSLVSSTTVTVTNARLAAESDAKKYPLLAVTICIAWITSLVRMTALAIGINGVLAQSLLAPAMAAIAVLIAAAIAFYMRAASDRDGAKQSFRNPLDFKFVLSLGALIAAISVAAKVASEMFGQGGLLAVALLSGFADVDPVTVSTARLAGSSISPLHAAQAILLAAGANLVTKMAATWIGGWRFAARLTAVGVLALLVGAAVLFLFRGLHE
jgi:uncharacterized membrane protein (DUF4010 family)